MIVLDEKKIAAINRQKNCIRKKEQKIKALKNSIRGNRVRICGTTFLNVIAKKQVVEAVKREIATQKRVLHDMENRLTSLVRGGLR